MDPNTHKLIVNLAKTSTQLSLHIEKELDEVEPSAADILCWSTELSNTGTLMALLAHKVTLPPPHEPPPKTEIPE